MKKQRGITLLALVITVIIIIILATVAINFLFGENGLITRAQQAAQMSDIENVREKLEMAKGTAVIDGRGYIDPDHYFDIIYEEGIIGDRENDVIDNGNGTYEVTTVEGYIFIITLLPTPEGAKDIDIEYSGTAEGPRIVNLTTEWTTNSISIEVETRNAEGATYTYEYRLTGSEEEWIKVETEDEKSNTCIINELTEGETYDIRVTVTTNDGSVTRKTSVHLGELPEGTITFESEWLGDGTASVTINTSAEGYRLQYQINAVEENGWTDIDNGGRLDGLTYPSTVYARIFDGTNGSEEASRSLVDETAPNVTVTSGGTTSNSISVSVNATDAESGMTSSQTYTYSIKVTGADDSTYTTPSNANAIASNSYTFTGLTQGTNYTVRVQVNGDKANNIGTETLENQITKTVGGPTEGLLTGNIVASSPTWSNGQASITLTTSTGYRIMYQVNVTTGQWIEISNGGQITELNHNDTVYARLYDGNNYGDYASVTIQDGNAPSVPIVNTNGYVSDTWTKNNITLSFSSTDTETGISKYQYSLNGSTWYDITSPFVYSTEGRTGCWFRAIDKVGNVSGNSSTLLLAKDSTAPTANITVEITTSNSISVKVVASDELSGIATYNYYLNGIFKGTGGNSFDFTGLTAETSYTLSVDVTDKAGNTAVESVQTKTKEATVADSKEEGIKYSNTTPIKDDLNNIVYIPGGFHIAEDSATRVEGGIVIEDDSRNQFVWIPTGIYQTSSGAKNNVLSRRRWPNMNVVAEPTLVNGDSVSR